MLPRVDGFIDYICISQCTWEYGKDRRNGGPFLRLSKSLFLTVWQRAKKRQRQVNRTRRRTGGTVGPDLRSKAKTLAAQGFLHDNGTENVCLIHRLSTEERPKSSNLFLPIWGFFETLKGPRLRPLFYIR